MRPPPTVVISAAEVAEFGTVRLSPPLLSPNTTPQPCVSHTCRWWPYSGSKEFEANAAMVIIILLSALICALGLNAAIRCFLSTTNRSDDHHNNRGNNHNRLPRTQQEMVKSNVAVDKCLEAAPAVVYSAEVRAEMAGAEAECAICLSEFVEGEEIRVLGRCKHGFHAQCIQEWLSSSHSSCPTCRRTCLPPSPSQSPPPPPQSAVEEFPVAAPA